MWLWHRERPVVTAWDVVGWWEVRRIPFNLIVGITGLITCIVCCTIALTSWLVFNSEYGWPDPPLFALVGVGLYAFMANVCYTGGWIAELFVRRAWPEQSERFATTTFACGLFLSVLLTLTPAILLLVGGIIGLIAQRVGASHAP